MRTELNELLILLWYLCNWARKLSRTLHNQPLKELITKSSKVGLCHLQLGSVEVMMQHFVCADNFEFS